MIRPSREAAMTTAKVAVMSLLALAAFIVVAKVVSNVLITDERDRRPGLALSDAVTDVDAAVRGTDGLRVLYERDGNRAVALYYVPEGGMADFTGAVRAAGTEDVLTSMSRPDGSTLATVSFLVPPDRAVHLSKEMPPSLGLSFASYAMAGFLALLAAVAASVTGLAVFETVERWARRRTGGAEGRA